ncbi:GFA family protein [Bowmanella denitrificans]|uniref:GFA family protein n=1 Tax=Bowmanella denitrificans TaxID=366582 RepID=A0ABN0XXG8_9ALTE
MVIKGSCLCGQVSYQINGPVGEIVHCHCRTCRKAHGAAFSSVASVQDRDFQLNGGALLKSFESSPGKRRFFCTECGTQIYAKRDNTEHVILRLGSLDDDPGSREAKHIWVADKASWYALRSDIPCFGTFE